MNEYSLKLRVPTRISSANMKPVLFLLAIHFVLVSNILYLTVLHGSILPVSMKGGIAGPLVRAVHGFAYAVFLAFCSRNTTPKNRYSRAVTGMQIGAAASFVLILLSSLPPAIFGARGVLSVLLQFLFYGGLIMGGYGDAMATPAMLGMIASTGEKKGPKYVGYFWTSVSISYIYVSLLAGGFLTMAKQNTTFRILPFLFDFLLSFLALKLFPKAYPLTKDPEPQHQNTAPDSILKKSNSLFDLFRTVKSNKFILACVLILAANQFAFNSLKTASQELSGSWKHLGLAGNAMMFSAASYLVARWWNKEKATKDKTKNIVMLSLGIILVVGFSIILLKESPMLGVGIMLFFGPFSAALHTGVNIFYAQFAIGQGSSNLGARLGMFSSMYRFLGSVGYLVTALIVSVHRIGNFPAEYFPFIAFIINGLPILTVMIFFAFITRGKDSK